jgi:serine/threonine-protein phosphatase 2A activator
MESSEKNTNENNQPQNIINEEKVEEKKCEQENKNQNQNLLYNYIEAKSLYTYEEAKKLGNQPWLIDKFKASPAYKTILDFIYLIQSKIKGMKISEMPPTKNECLLQFDPLFERLEQIFANNPPKKGEARFDDPVFKRFHDELTSKFTDIMNETILSPKNMPENIIIELKTYFLDSFGNQFRLDYGTGHELNFFCVLLILYKSGVYTENDFPYLIFKILYKYVLFVRKLQVDYMLEPAGARGVWGLDEYQFLPFIFGASQLIGNRMITPKSIRDNDILLDYKDEYLYLDCVDHIKSVKKGATFPEYAPILYSITNVKSWDKVASGLVKMYEDDVLKKIVIIQHFYFGSVLLLE